MLVYRCLLHILVEELREEHFKAVTLSVKADGRENGLDILGKELLVAGEVVNEVGCDHARDGSSLDLLGDGHGHHSYRDFCLLGALLVGTDRWLQRVSEGICIYSEGVIKLLHYRHGMDMSGQGTKCMRTYATTFYRG
jgi:hypothetical protein